MSLKKKPVNGMKDILPAEMRLRDYVTGVIKETYGSYGFCAIDTPCVEHIENLSSKQGGENEKLIFKILKRGEKLQLAEAKSVDELVDGGLRYDLTVPLVRFYANHMNELPTPFKALQIGPVWRADRPQRGRYRQFVQCDIDILGDATNLAEIELILATGQALEKIGFQDFNIRLSDRRILRAMAAYCGFSPDEHEKVFIHLDKWDKIGLTGVLAQMEKDGLTKAAMDKFAALIAEMGDEKAGAGSLGQLKGLAAKLGTLLDAAVLQNMVDIIESVAAISGGAYGIIFDPTLVRGMGYYTGTIFEVQVANLAGSLGGGGRYDKMVGDFSGQDVAGIGFSLGFERIILLLMEGGVKPPDKTLKKAYLMEKGLSADRVRETLKMATNERPGSAEVLVAWMNKNKKFQKECLAAEGYGEIVEIYANGGNTCT